MALAFWVDGRQDSIAKAFAAHDEYLSVFSFFISPKAKRMMTPEDDFYTAPFCFMPKHRKGGFIVFTAQVPWLQGNPMERESAHEKAREWQDHKGQHEPPHVGSVEQFQKFLNLKEGDLFTFTTSGCYPTKVDVSEALEDKAVKVTCDAMGWEIPENWRLFRKEERNVHGMPLLDLADWDKRKDNNSHHHTNSNVKITCEGNEHADAQEEKKDSAEEYQC